MKLFRPAQTRRPGWFAPAFVLTYAALSGMAYSWTVSTGGLAVLWMCNGLVAAALLLLPRNASLAVLAAGWAMDCGGAVLIGHTPLSQAMLIASMDAAESTCAAMLARRFCGAALDMTQLARLRALILFAILPATLMAGTLGTLLSHLLFHEPLAPLWVVWAGGDFLGMTIAAPAVLLLARPRRRKPPRTRVERLTAIGMLTLAALLCFEVESQPILFMLVVAVLMATFWLDAPAVALSNVLISIVAAGMTISGVGPIGAARPEMGPRILLLQLFLAALTLSSMTAAAMHAERDRVVRRLGRTLAAAREARRRADEASRAKGRFLATMSHEIRTPLNGVLGMAQAMAADPLPEAQRDRLEIIRRSGETLLALLNDLLDLSKIEAGKLELEQLDFDLAEAVQAACEPFRDLAESKGVAFGVTLAGDSGFCRGDPTRLRQVLGNLVSNAVKFTDRGRIEVSVRRSGDVVRFAVVDSGVGIRSGAQARLFEKFVQADESTTRRFGGTGLGLAICRELVERMGGAIAVESREGEGSCFSFGLPLPRATIGAVSRGSEPARDRQVARVLAAEDNHVNQIVLRTLLEQLGFEVTTVAHGAQAVEAWRAGGWDLVLMDVQMPVMDGITAAKAIRALERDQACPRTPIIALTANAMTHQSAEYLAAGMDATVAKPIEAAKLLSAIQTALDAPGEVVDVAAA